MTVGRVNAATTPMMPRVIKISARVNTNFLAAKRLGSEAAKKSRAGSISRFKIEERKAYKAKQMRRRQVG